MRAAMSFVFFVWLFLTVFVSGGAFAQGDLDEDGIPDAEDPETLLTTSKELEAGEYTFLHLVIANASVLTLSSDPDLPGFKGVKINAENITIGPTSSISADGKGYGAASGPGAGGSGWGGGAGGGYGGKGGEGYAYPGGLPYGSAIEPVDVGSGGGNSYAYPGSPGGGAIQLIVTGTLTNNGIIGANGPDAPQDAGGGSGGSIYVTTDVLSGAGSFLANGGDTAGGGGGGGGRIAIYYQTSSFTGEAEAKGGTGTQNKNGADGTVGFFDTLENDFYAGHSWCFQEAHSPCEFNRVVLGDGSRVICENNVTITAKVLSVGHFSVLSVLGTNTMIHGDDVTVTNGSVLYGNLHLTGQNLTIDSTSSISANSAGYGAGSGPGGVGGTGWSGGGGAGYGGKGGDGRGSGGGLAYGSATQPADLGSGGGNSYAYPGSPGGGAIRLIMTGTLTNDGIISANAGDPAGDGGAGSGGSVYVTTGALSGSGAFRANGASSASTGGGGGGGRIAVYYQTSSFAGIAEARGGTGYRAADDGTVGFFDTLKNDFHAGHLWCFQAAHSPFVFNAIVLADGVRVVCEDNVNISAKVLSISTGSFLWVPGTNTAIHAEEVTVTDGSGITGNVHLSAKNITVDTTSVISGDGAGYGAGSGPGGVPGTGWSGGGGAGYGGNGGAGRGAGGGASYGSAVEPVDLGSGGGNSYSYPGSPGGGALRLVVTGTLTNNGIISANGTVPAGDAGAGSGGSIYVTTSILSGSGSFTANGGSSAATGGGGGGGRIAIYYETSDFTGTVEAKGGTGYANGEDSQPRLSSDSPTSCTRLAERTSSESSFVETVADEEVTFVDVAVEGDLSGVLNFTEFELVSISTGSFAGKGFTTGTWNATLDSLPYEGEWKGMLFFRSAERTFYLKGTTSGEIIGILEGTLTESIVASDVYEQFRATWTIAKIKGELVSATLSLAGTLVYQESTEYPSTQLDVLQSFVEGTSVGHYAGPLSTTLTHLRVNDQSNPYDGRGFSTLSYTSNFGSGEGWTYDEMAAPGTVELIGHLSSPLSGIAIASLTSTAEGRTLSVAVERTDYGLPPMPDLEVVTWGRRNVSPGQMIDYAIEYRNDGIKDADNVVLIDLLPSVVEYVSSSAGGAYNPPFHEVIWRLGTVRPKTRGYATVRARVAWGLPGHYLYKNRVAIYTPDDELDVYLHPETTPQGIAEHLAGSSTPPGALASREAAPLQGPKFDVRQDACVMKNIQDAIQLLQHKRPNIANKFNLLLNNGQVWIDHSRDSTKPENQFRAEWVYGRDGWRLYFGKHPDVTGYELYCPQTFADFFHDHPDARDERIALLAGTILHETTHSNQPWWWRPWAKEWWAHSEEIRFYVDVAFQEIPQCRNEFGAAMLQLGRNVVNDFVTNYGANTWMSQVDGKLAAEIGQLNAGQKPQPNVLPPEKPPADNEDEHENEVIVARDPNIKYGPEGSVAAGQKLDYMVEFENEGEGIAFGVYFIDTLDEDLDDSTLTIGPVLSTADDSEIGPPGTYDPLTRTITWSVGEVGPHEGGYADLSVNVRSDAPEGTEIINFGIVYFPSVPEVTRTNAIVNQIPYQKGSVQVLGKEGDSLTIEWEPFGDGQYTVQTTTDLVSGEWVDAAGEWPTEAQWCTLGLSGTKQLFIRVKAGGQ